MNDFYENRFQGKMFDEPSILNELNPVLRENFLKIFIYLFHIYNST